MTQIVDLPMGLEVAPALSTSQCQSLMSPSQAAPVAAVATGPALPCSAAAPVAAVATGLGPALPCSAVAPVAAVATGPALPCSVSPPSDWVRAEDKTVSTDRADRTEWKGIETGRNLVLVLPRSSAVATEWREIETGSNRCPVNVRPPLVSAVAMGRRWV